MAKLQRPHPEGIGRPWALTAPVADSMHLLGASDVVLTMSRESRSLLKGSLTGPKRLVLSHFGHERCLALGPIGATSGPRADGMRCNGCCQRGG